MQPLSTQASSSEAAVYPTPAPSARSPPGSTPAPAGAKKSLSCQRCRAQKRRCEWPGDGHPQCKACTKEDLQCTGPAARAPYPKRASAKSAAVVSTATVLARPRSSLSPTSSEASLASSEMLGSLTADLIATYKSHWAYRIPNLGPEWADELILRGRQGSKSDGGVGATLTLACAALGARSSSHSSIINLADSLGSLKLADEPGTAPNLTQLGARRAQACATLARQAVQRAHCIKGNTIEHLYCLMFIQYLLSTMEVDRETTRKFYEHSLGLFRALHAREPASHELSGAIRTFINRDAFIALFAHSPLLITEDEAHALCPELAVAKLEPVLIAPGLFNAEATDSYATAHFLAHIRAVVKLFGSRPAGERFGPKHRARLAKLWEENDTFLDVLQTALDAAKVLEPEAIWVIGAEGVLWQGSPDSGRTPAQNKARLVTLLTSKVSHRADIDIFSHQALLKEQQRGTMDGDPLELSFFMIHARERARAALRKKVRAIDNYLSLPQARHTTIAKQFQNLESTVADWASLVLGQYGDADGPLTREAELTDEEVAVFARGLKVAGYSYAWTALRLEELNGGLRARQEEKLTASQTTRVVAVQEDLDSLFG